MGQISVMVLLHHIKQLRAQGNIHHLLEPQLCWYYDQFEVMLGFLTYHEETDDGRLLADELTKLAHETEDGLDELHKRCSTEQRQIFLQINHEAKLIEDIVGVTNKIGELMSGSCRFEYDRRREKDVQELKQSFPRSTRGWVTDPEADVALDRTKHIGRLVDRLINGGPPELDLIVIRGDEDTGMTALVKKVYNDASVIDYFESRAWVFVPDMYTVRDLLLTVLKDIMVITELEGIHGMDEWQLKRQLQKQLGGRRYLIVFVDIPHADVWTFDLKDAFPSNKKGSRIIFTVNYTITHHVLSNSSDHAEFELVSDGLFIDYSETRRYSCFFLGYLSEEEKWKQFSKTIFGEDECPKELKHLGTSILQTCDFLGMWPFVRVIVGRILRGSGKTDLIKWSNMAARYNGLTDFWSGERVAICYHEMPQHLKPCLLYLGLFPQGFEIPVKQLMRLWIAEGLVQWVETTNTTNKARSMEDVAEDYLEGLIGLNFIQITERRSDGGPKSFRIREPVRKVCITLSSKEGFMEVYDSFRDIHRRPRRLSIFGIGCAYFMSSKKVSNVRSLCPFLENTRHTSEEKWISFFKSSPLLRVLNLGEVEVGKLPKGIEELFHLKYLRLKPAKNIGVPKSIFNLWNLQTIDLRTTRFSELPKRIWKMQQLRHLYLNGDGRCRLPKPESEDCTLPNLQTLSYILIDPDDDINISERAPNLRKLGLCSFLYFPTSEQHVVFNFPPHLRSLTFAEECAFDKPIKFPDTIAKITIKGVHLEQDIIEMFGKLQNLQILKLIETSFDDGELFFREYSFPQLQMLKFEASNIETWRLEEGAMPNLHKLVISKCPQLIEPPSQLQKMNTLQELELYWASSRLAKKLHEDFKENRGLKFVIHSISSA